MAETEANYQSRQRLEQTYLQEKPQMLRRLRATGRTLEEAEDLLHDVYAETTQRLPLVASIINLPAWINTLLKRRLIDNWRAKKRHRAAGEVDVAEETINEIIAGAGFDPHEAYVRASLIDALNDALKALPPDQRQVLEAQVFGGKTFRQIAEQTGQSIDTLTARKRYAVQKLALALRYWIEQ